MLECLDDRVTPLSALYTRVVTDLGSAEKDVRAAGASAPWSTY